MMFSAVDCSLPQGQRAVALPSAVLIHLLLNRRRRGLERRSALRTLAGIPVEGARTALANLDRSILSKAFCGELVPHDPNDEPASVMLERTRGARANESEAASVRRARKAADEAVPTDGARRGPRT